MLDHQTLCLSLYFHFPFSCSSYFSFLLLPIAGTIVHGILVSSLFSTLFGRSIPGAVYVSQSVRFKRPVHVGARVVARMQIVGMEPRRKGVLLVCATTCSLIDKDDEAVLTLAVEGSAEVLLMPPTTASS